MNLYDQGTRMGRVHGTAHVGEVSKHLPEEISAGLFDTPYQIIENVRMADQDMIALDADIAKNVTRPAFLSAWKVFYAHWRDFYASHTTLLAIAYHGPQTTRVQTDELRARLNGWLQAYQAEGAPPGAMIGPSRSLFAPDGTDRWDTSTVVLLSVGGALVGVSLLAYLGFTTYKYFQVASRQVDDVKKIGVKLAEGRLSGALSRS